MSLLRRRALLPLLTKELVEQAARKRTYLVRVLYAVLLGRINQNLVQRMLGVGRKGMRNTGIVVLEPGLILIRDHF